jgi:hypothetical protein
MKPIQKDLFGTKPVPPFENGHVQRPLPIDEKLYEMIALHASVEQKGSTNRRTVMVPNPVTTYHGWFPHAQPYCEQKTRAF